MTTPILYCGAPDFDPLVERAVELRNMHVIHLKALDVEEARAHHEYAECGAAVLACDLTDAELEFVRGLRDMRIPIIVIVPQNATAADEVAVIAAGADIVLRRPVHVDVLAVYMRALCGRGAANQNEVRSFGRLTVDVVEECVYFDGKRIPLTWKESEIVALLVKRRSIVTREMMLIALYGIFPEAPGIKITDVFVCKIRAKLRQHTGTDAWIETVWGRGYMWNADADARARAAG